MKEVDDRVRVSKLSVVPVTKDGLRSFARVDVEFISDSCTDGPADSVRIEINFNVDQLTLDQIKDFAIMHAKSLMNRCVTDAHLKVGDQRLMD
ncbi:hypothetical protein [Herbaspirillum sp. YR522]|uniref:hypothetical protein n=1 Tax=Herbaspirillum sp. YR522 TaxID=1144342 RepID=UPI00058C4284|nr:hypothetical protein [Herbaspirillum sp. YR522]